MFYLVAVLALALVAVAAIVGFPFFLQWLAVENVFFTTVKEGTAKAIMRGKSLDRFIMKFAEYHLNAPGKPWYKQGFTDIDEKIHRLPDWEVLYHGKGNRKGFAEESDEYYDVRSEWEPFDRLLKHLGLHWVGWPWASSVYVYAFEWNETYTERTEGKEKVLPRAEPTDFIYVADFTYAIRTDSAETNDRLPTDELTLVTVAIRNPYRALFSGEDWIRRITAAINRHVRNFVGSKGYDELISITKGKDVGVTNTAAKWAEDFSIPIIRLSELLPDETEESPPPKGLRGRYGVEIRTADLQTVELSGTAEEKKQHQEAATKVYTAEQDAKAKRLTGQAEADVIKMRGDQEAEALAARLKVIKEHGDAGMLLAQLDAIQESSKGAGNTVVWANSPFAPLTGLLKPEAKKGDNP
ncbi:MAG: hypothetical protein WC217_02540 [Candidatus Paceibacterota bacterium]|jgi:regulator of protease activity HflC (stomatin/prohibitin superfamily)